MVELKEAVALINLQQLDFSIVLVNPKPVFMERVNELCRSNGRSAYKYFEEENSVWAIPKSDSISDAGGVAEYTRSLKSKFFAAELLRFGISEKDFAEPFSEGVFDRYFSISIRDEVSSISSLV